MRYALVLLLLTTAASAQIAPKIVLAPAPQLVVSGTGTTLSVQATGTAPLTYTWTAPNGVTVGTGPTLSVSNVTGDEFYRVTVRNAASSVASDFARVHAIPDATAAPPAVAWFDRGIKGSGSVLSNYAQFSTGRVIQLEAGFTGSLPMTYQWEKNNLPISGETSLRLELDNVQLSTGGSYRLRATNAFGSITTETFTFDVLPTSAPPAVLLTPGPDRKFTEGLPADVSVKAYGELPITYQWSYEGRPIPGATDATYLIPAVTMSTVGLYSRSLTNAHGTVSGGGIVAEILDPIRLVNASVRARSGSGDRTLIVGFSLGGVGSSAAPFVLVRAAGPALAEYGVTDPLRDPRLDVYRSGTPTALTGNDNWGGSSGMAAEASAVGAFPFPDPTSSDAALETSFAKGGYSAVVTSNGADSGIALAELYDTTVHGASGTHIARLVNLSARTEVGTGDDILVAGFTIGGTGTAKKLLVRAIGPSLASYRVSGVLANPMLQVFQGTRVLQSNDDWNGDPAIAAAADAVGAFKLDPASKDSALLITLPPGGYTAQVSGVGGTTGVALVEVYEVLP